MEEDKKMRFPYKRRQYYRPIENDYDYYEIEPMMSIYRRRQAAYKKSRNHNNKYK